MQGAWSCRLREGACVSVCMHAGGAVVQIAEDRDTREAVALKFFLSRPQFEREVALYTDSTQPLGGFLPEVRRIVDGEADEPGFRVEGAPLPPCIVMEKGESLDKWAAACSDGLDMVTGLQACFCCRFLHTALAGLTAAAARVCDNGLYRQGVLNVMPSR
jgi:hypothetical protein